MNITIFVIAALFIYMPFHLFEEAIGDFPKWMYEHKWLPFHMTHGHWMANNIFIYYPLLILSFLLYYFGKESFLFCGIGILLWGIINFGDHFFYSIKDRKISPGIITGTVFLINSIMGFVQISRMNLSIVTIILSIIIGGVLFGAPIGLCVVFYKFFDKYIK